jgi:hypothetical protein
LDVRWSLPLGAMAQRFIAAEQIQRAARLMTRTAQRADVYVGVALRDRRYGGKAAITGSRLLYAECDQPDAYERLQSFGYTPSMILASGSPGHLHIYWSLHEHAGPAAIESANRRLALALAGDSASVDVARILRPPATLNHKHSPPLPVRLIALAPSRRHEIAKLTASLPIDPQSDQPRTARHRATPRHGRTKLDRALLAIPAQEYARVLAHREPNRAGKILCPFHDEQTPSLQLYPDGTFYCYGRHSPTQACRKGGTIFDFAAALWRTGTREQDFLTLRRRLARTFALTALSSD